MIEVGKVKPPPVSRAEAWSVERQELWSDRQYESELTTSPPFGVAMAYQEM